MSESVLKAEQLSKHFGSVQVLHGVSFNLWPGEVHAFIGENGAGKSTLMKLLAGYLAPSEGRLELFGESVSFKNSSEAEAKGIVLIHQEFNLAEDLSVEGNIFLGRELSSGLFVRKSDMAKEARELMQSLKTEVNPQERVRNLSVSQKQMVEIAKAVSRDAKILIMDEPTDVLTGTETEVLFDLIRRLQKSGVTIIYISHKLSEIKEIADRVSVLRDGHLITTQIAKALSQDEMASLMVGRDLEDMYPPKKEPQNQILFAAKSVSVPGWAKDISFELRRGEVLGFAGLVGAGRTELFEGILGLRPRTGELHRNGHRVTIDNPKDAANLRIVYLSEDRKGKGILTDMRLRPNVTLLALEKYAKPFISITKETKALERAVKTFDIRAGDLQMRAGDLSGGNQQKLALAKIMDITPDVIILDEPTRGIDVGTKRELYFFISDLTKQGKGCIIISSEMPELIGLCHRVVVMQAGQITGVLSGEEIREDEIVRYATGLKRQESRHAARA